MASNTKQTESIRLNKERKQGKQRKRDLERKGTTRSEAELFGNVQSSSSK